MTMQQRGDLLAYLVLIVLAFTIYHCLAEPVARALDNPANEYFGAAIAGDPTCPLYTAPPQSDRTNGFSRERR